MEESKPKFSFKKYTHEVDFNNYEPLEPLEAIRAKCLDCCCYDMKEVKLCDITSCPLNRFIATAWQPEKKKRNWSEEKRKELSERMKLYHANKKKVD